MIPHNGTYCPDIFRWRAMPDTTIMEILPYGSDVPSAHSFPKVILTSKYVITSDITPIGTFGGIAQLINNVVLTLLSENYYKEIVVFDMNNNGYHMFIYERIKECDSHEIDLYKEEFKDYIKQFPNNYTYLTQLQI